MSGSESNRVVRKEGVDALGAVHHLRHAQVDHDARERERVRAIESVLPSHELEHAVESDR